MSGIAKEALAAGKDYSLVKLTVILCFGVITLGLVGMYLQADKWIAVQEKQVLNHREEIETNKRFVDLVDRSADQTDKQLVIEVERTKMQGALRDAIIAADVNEERRHKVAVETLRLLTEAIKNQ